MLRSITTTLLVLGCVLSSALIMAANGFQKTLYVRAGHTLVEAGFDGTLQRIALGDGRLADVRLIEDTNELLLIGKKPGTTDIRMWYQNGQQQHVRLVVTPGQDDFSRKEGPSLTEIQGLLMNISGITITSLGDDIIVDGRVAEASQFQRIESLTKRFDNVVSLVKGPKVAKEPTILIQAKLLEVRRSALRDIGVNWNDAFAGPTFALFGDLAGSQSFSGLSSTGTGGFGQYPVGVNGLHGYLGIQSSLGSLINILQSNGDARILAEPTLSCISGGSADFLAGGEIPLPVEQRGGGISVEFKEYGVKLHVEPVVDDTGFIRTQVEVEVSSLDGSVSVMGLPGFLTRRATTEMNIDQGQTMVIAGLLNSEDAKNVDKVPGLGHVPVLGELFKSREFRSNETELVVLVTPIVGTSQKEQVSAMQQRFDTMKQQSNERLLFQLED